MSHSVKRYEKEIHYKKIPKRMRAQDVFLTGIVAGVELDDDLEPAAWLESARWESN
jgi:hypothetical protein